MKLETWKHQSIETKFKNCWKTRKSLIYKKKVILKIQKLIFPKLKIKKIPKITYDAISDMTTIFIQKLYIFYLDIFY